MATCPSEWLPPGGRLTVPCQLDDGHGLAHEHGDNDDSWAVTWDDRAGFVPEGHSSWLAGMFDGDDTPPDDDPTGQPVPVPATDMAALTGTADPFDQSYAAARKRQAAAAADAAEHSGAGLGTIDDELTALAQRTGVPVDRLRDAYERGGGDR